MRKISRFDRMNLEKVVDAVEMSSIGVYSNYDDYCYFATSHGYEESHSYMPSELVDMFVNKKIPEWATHVLWIMK